MKIIATVGNRDFIVQATDHELAQIMGFDYASEAKCPKIETGATIPVSALWQALSISRGRRDEITKLANNLRQAAGNVDKINQALAAPIVEVKS